LIFFDVTHLVGTSMDGLIMSLSLAKELIEWFLEGHSCILVVATIEKLNKNNFITYSVIINTIYCNLVGYTRLASQRGFVG